MDVTAPDPTQPIGIHTHASHSPHQIKPTSPSPPLLPPLLLPPSLPAQQPRQVVVQQHERRDGHRKGEQKGQGKYIPAPRRRGGNGCGGRGGGGRGRRCCYCHGCCRCSCLLVMGGAHPTTRIVAAPLVPASFSSRWSGRRPVRCVIVCVGVCGVLGLAHQSIETPTPLHRDRQREDTDRQGEAEETGPPPSQTDISKRFDRNAMGGRRVEGQTFPSDRRPRFLYRVCWDGGWATAELTTTHTN